MTKKRVVAKKLLRSRTRTTAKPITSGLSAGKTPSRGKKRSMPRRRMAGMGVAPGAPAATVETRGRENGIGAIVPAIVPQLSRKAAKAVSHLVQAAGKGGAHARAAIDAAIPSLKKRVNDGYAVTKKAAVGIGHEVRETTTRVAKKVTRAVGDQTPGRRIAEAQEAQKDAEQAIAKQIDDAVALRVAPAVAQQVALLEERIASGLKGQIADCVRQELEPLVTRRFAAAEGRLSKELDHRIKAASDRIAGALAQRLTASFDRKLDAAVTGRHAPAEARSAGN